MTSPELLTAEDPRVQACTAIPGSSHDYRPVTYQHYNRPHTSMVCVWCHAIRCGNYDQPNPCIEPYHHRTPHRDAIGVAWPQGHGRPTGGPA